MCMAYVHTCALQGVFDSPSKRSLHVSNVTIAPVMLSDGKTFPAGTSLDAVKQHRQMLLREQSREAAKRQMEGDDFGTPGMSQASTVELGPGEPMMATQDSNEVSFNTAEPTASTTPPPSTTPQYPYVPLQQRRHAKEMKYCHPLWLGLNSAEPHTSQECVLEQLAVHKTVPPVITAGSLPLIEILAGGAKSENVVISDPTRVILVANAANMHAKVSAGLTLRLHAAIAPLCSHRVRQIFPTTTYTNGAGAASQWSDFKTILNKPFEAAKKQLAKKLLLASSPASSPAAILTDAAQISLQVSTSHFDLLAALSEASAALSHVQTLLQIDVVHAGNTTDHLGRAVEMLHSCPGGIREMVKAATSIACGSWRALAELILSPAASPSVGFLALDCLSSQLRIFAMCVLVYEEESNSSDSAQILKEELLKFPNTPANVSSLTAMFLATLATNTDIECAVRLARDTTANLC